MQKTELLSSSDVADPLQRLMAAIEVTYPMGVPEHILASGEQLLSVVLGDEAKEAPTQVNGPVLPFRVECSHFCASS
jgi:hypothetical protein